MLAKIISFIMSIIMAIFPVFGDKKTVSNDDVAEAVIYTLENNDASAMEAVMCKNIKDNYPNLTDEINTMLSYIEGDIENITWETFGGYYENDGKGNFARQNDQSYEIFTTKGVYGIILTIETANSSAPEETGIRAIGLQKLKENPNPNSYYKYIFDENLYKIFATEGIGELHNKK